MDKLIFSGMSVALPSGMKNISFKFHLSVFAASAVLLLGFGIPSAFLMQRAVAQSSISGDIAGTITDPSGAVVPNASVSVKSLDTGAIQNATTNNTGAYRVSLLKPGNYQVTASAPGFQNTTVQVVVSTGVVTAGDLKLSVGSSAQTVEVSATTEPLIHTEDANISTSFNQQQIQNMPNPGNDITFMGQLAPGSIVNTTTQATNGMFGYGNFSSFGLPATSNNFTVNGTQENDPFFNLNNSGATNLLLGNNEIAEATVISNAYAAQYGGLGGAQMNEITRSGSNRYHGNLVYWWNGRLMNANSYFNNQQGVKRPFVNANQWAASIGGPVKKDKFFYFLDTEGLRVIFPTNAAVYIPSASYQSRILGQVAANNPSEVPFYQNMFKLYNNAPGAASAVPLVDSVGVNPDVNTFRSTAASGANEWILAGRVDWNIGNNDKMYVRYKQDKGFQPSFTDPINPLFDLVSKQPQYEGQLAETHSFSPNIVNQFTLNGSYYRAIFGAPNLAENLAAFPGTFVFVDGPNSQGHTDQFNQLNPYGFFQQGRNATQYGFLDDVSITHGSHTIRVGASFKRDDITDYDPMEYTSPLLIGLGPNASPGPTFTFDNGYAYSTQQAFPLSNSQPIAFYQLGAYVQDDWSIRPNFKLNAGIRVEHNSNPISTKNVFARLSGDFFGQNPDTSTPYSSYIAAGQHQAFHGYQRFMVEPRIGFNWSLSANTVLRGGFGVFADVFPGTVADSLIANPPTEPNFTTFGALLDPSLPNSGSQISRANATAFRSGFTTGASFDTLSAANPAFSAPNFVSGAQDVQYPQYEEWSAQIEHQFPKNTALAIGYVGNHGYHEPVVNNSANAYGFGTLPASAPVPSFAEVQLYQSAASSNYNGLVVTANHREKYATITLNYTYSHALDEISNGGFLPFNPGNSSNPNNPYDLSQNYGNADYDVRHNLTASYVVQLPYWGGPHALTDHWQFSGTVFYHTGFPFSITDNATQQTLQGQNYHGPLFAAVSGSPAHHCSASAVANLATGAGTPCFDPADFSTPTGFNVQRRNQFFGPHYVDTDFAAQKGFGIPHWEGATLNLGAQFFNLFNHPNFAQPVSDISNSLFGKINSVVSTPTSLFGNGLGGDASPRLIQLKASFQF
jgi:hypothetical protein